MRSMTNSFLVATQFLTRLPVSPNDDFSADALASSAAFFPVVGLLVGAGGCLLRWILLPHTNASIVAVAILIYLVVVTGGLHEDALADAADGFGGGFSRERVLEIMHDSRIGSFGAIAIGLGLLSRFALLSDLSAKRFISYFIAAHVLSRWSALPLASFLPAARPEDGQGRRIAQKVSASSFLLGTILCAGIVIFLLKWRGVYVVAAAIAVVAATGAYYHRRIGGITGDCLGATNQLAEVAVYFVGVILR
jgi:adenosylcobinamide-GDP ribazoletransferase